jgi:hypothetical protein
MVKLGRRFLQYFGVKLTRVPRASPFRRPVHFLHIGKNAGTQIGYVIDDVNAAQNNVQFLKHGHSSVLSGLPKGEAYFFSLRDPIARFKSGFYSRKRMGRPRLENPWTPSQARMFEEFEHANDLAEALFDPGMRGERAMAGMLSVGHLGNGQIDWFKKGGDIFEIRPPVWIIRQSQLQQDLEELLQRLGVPCAVRLTNDPVASHRNDYTSVPDLSEKAQQNLRRWHAADFEFIAFCETWMERQYAAGGRQ